MPKVLSLAWETILEIEHAFEDKHCQLEDILELFQRLHNDVQNIHKELAVYINTLSWDHPTICYNDNDDEECTIAITTILSTEEPDNSLSMGGEHLDTIPKIESDEVKKSSVENLVPIPSESEGIPDNMCDVPFHDNSPPLDISKDQFEDFSESNDDSTLIDDDSFSIDDIEYVEASSPDSELISLEVMEIVIPKIGGIDADILLTIKDDILREKLLNINLLIANDKHCQLEDILELFRRLHNDVQNIHEELAVYINTLNWDRPTICYSDDDDEDCTIAITPILSTEEPDNSLSMGDEHLDTILAMESDEFIKSSVENLVPIPNQFEDFSDSNDDSTLIDDDSFSIDNIEYVEASPPDYELISLEVMEIVIPKVGGIDDDILLTIKDDILYEKLLNINLLIANIEALKDNPTPSSDFMTKSSSKISSGSTTTCYDISLSDYEAYYDNHVKEISSGSTTTHSHCSLYDSFIFDLLINPFPPAGRSDFYEFAYELAHIISLPEYDCFCFKNEPNSRDFTMNVVEYIFPTREPRVHVYNVFPAHPTLQLNLDFLLFSESLFTYVVWIFLHFLLYSVAPQYLLSFGNKDTIFDLGIYSYHILSFMPDVSHRSGTFIKFNVYPKHLNESPMEILFSTCSPMDQ
nr:hypothetical protein [Tanacetum cinerariifolium]